jgi:hypothetical protein
MLQFTQAVLPSTAAGPATPLETGKGFDKDQIAKLKVACGVIDACAIPNIWFVIQSTKGKSFNSYRAHLSKSTESWCRANHIERDKSIYLPSKFVEELVAHCFNPGGPVAQYSLVVKRMSMMVCRSVTAVEAEYQQGYEEAMDQTKGTMSLEELLKGNRGKVISPPQDYMHVVGRGRLDMYRTKVLMYRTMVLMARLTKVRL